ncbi:hypothetical protein RJ640_019416 [Escallonia rubra]|uniref:Neprosin PEP catalytic domain-containing protein n=1 Tax=Escallonia rubra TaxID=112253 RepID=A0AA88QMM2_9ASTE|nr:hypothetical protein RJ640_019416 [Escallonia rubra]
MLTPQWLLKVLRLFHVLQATTVFDRITVILFVALCLVNLTVARKLQVLGNTHVSTVMAIDGSTYNCVDVHQQHALGKPILAGHNIEDTVNGNWWFFGPTGDAVGFWPRALFTSLGQGADSVRLGGQVLTPESDNVRPPMGSGLFNNGNYYTTCYMSDVQVNTDSYSPPDDSWIQGVDSRCYFEGDHSHKGGTLRYSFVFGGSGGKDHATCVW